MTNPVALDLLALPLTGNRLIEASAGTGKTFTIAALYLRLVLGHGNNNAYSRPLTPPEILVVTFTEAATQELRDRIRLRLTEAAHAFRQGESHDEVLTGLLTDYSPSEYAFCARRLELAAQWMDEAAISTIHGWCNRMLAEHAFASGSLFSQQLSTDLTAVKLQAARDYWRSFYYALPPTALTELLRYWQSPEQLWQSVARLTSVYLEHDTGTLAGYALPKDAIASCQQERQKLLQQLSEQWQHWLPELRQLLEQAISAKAVNGRQLQQRYLDNWLQKLQLWIAEPDAKLELGTGWHRLSPEGIAECWKNGSVPEHPAFAGIQQLQIALQTLPEPRQQLMQHAASWLAGRIQSALQQQALMGFDDMLLRLHKALYGAQGKQLASLIRQQYPVALIDEFQDTDPIQYQIFSAIYLEQSASSEPENNHALLLIGDPKQAIYAFRGADIYTYLQARLATTGRHYTLDTNFRSDAQLVNAVNFIFNQAEQRAAGAFLFRRGSGASQTDPLPFYPVKAKGNDWKLHVDQQAAAALTAWLPNVENDKVLSNQAYLELYANGCASYITKVLTQASTGSAYFLNSEGEKRAVQPSDIAILVNNQQEAQAIRRKLSQRQIRSVYLSDRESVFSSVVATDLQLILQACAAPEEDNLLRSAIGCATVGLSLYELDQLQQQELQWEKLCLRFKGYQLQWQRFGVLPMLRSLLFDFAIPARLRQLGEGERALTDLLHLAELLQQAAQKLDGEQALLRFLAEHIQQTGSGDSELQKVRLESDAALVQVITIHKSKGLEYPLVFLPFICAARSVNPNQLPLGYHDAEGKRQFSYQPDTAILAAAEQERLAEDIRKCYVALTRAKYGCWLGLAPLAEQSAISYLLATSPQDPAGFTSQVKTSWALCSAIKLSDLPAVTTDTYQPIQPAMLQSSARTIAHKFRQLWWIASYSALTRELGDNSYWAQHGPERATDKLLPELYSESATEPSTEQLQESAIQYQFIAGPQAGTFLHGMLEWMGQQGFMLVKQQPQLLAAELAKRCQLRGWQADCTALQQWLTQLADIYFKLPDSLKQQPTGSSKPISLAGLASYQVELEFWLPCQQVDILQLDRLLQHHIWPGKPRPALLAGQLNGMLKGFIDLVFCHDQRYVVCDYKSNLAGLSVTAYSESALQHIMLQKRYDLQAVLYCLALHRLLRSRMVNYDYDKDVAGAMHWFIRGVAAPDHGIVWLQPSLTLINDLDRLFRRETVNAG